MVEPMDRSATATPIALASAISRAERADGAAATAVAKRTVMMVMNCILTELFGGSEKVV